MIIFVCINSMIIGAKPEMKDVGWLLLLGATGVWGNQFFVFIGLHLTSPIQGVSFSFFFILLPHLFLLILLLLLVSIMQPTTPVFAAALSILLRLESPRLLKLLGIAFAFIGAITMVGVRSIDLFISLS